MNNKKIALMFFIFTVFFIVLSAYMIGISTKNFILNGTETIDTNFFETMFGYIVKLGWPALSIALWFWILRRGLIPEFRSIVKDAVFYLIVLWIIGQSFFVRYISMTTFPSDQVKWILLRGISIFIVVILVVTAFYKKEVTQKKTL